jgi:hypothetical protein
MIQWYPMIVLIVWFVPMINRIGEAIGWQNDVIDDIRGFMILIHGFLDAIAYCYTVPVLSLWKSFILSLFGVSQNAVNHLDVGEDVVSPSITGLLGTEVVSSSVSAFSRQSASSEGPARASITMQRGASPPDPSGNVDNNYSPLSDL